MSKHVGYYPLGFLQVELRVRPGTGAEYYSQPRRGSMPRIVVGLSVSSWPVVVEYVLHETMELASDIRGCKWVSRSSTGSDCAKFVMSHDEFSEVVIMAADFLASALPDLAVAYKASRSKGGSQ